MKKRNLFSRIIAAALSAALVILSPGLEAYRVFAAGLSFSVGAPGTFAVAAWTPAMRTYLASSPNSLGNIDFGALSRGDREALAPLLKHLQSQGLTPQKFAALDSGAQQKAFTEAASAVAADVKAESEALISDVSSGKRTGYELQQAVSRLDSLSSGGLYYLEAADQHRVLQAKAVATKQLEAQRNGGVSASIKKTASKLGSLSSPETRLPLASMKGVGKAFPAYTKPARREAKNGAAPEQEKAQVMASLKLDPQLLSELKTALSARKEAFSKVDPSLAIRIEPHFRARNPVVLVNGPVKDIMYLHEVWERVRLLEFSWLKPQTWLPDRTDPSKMTMERQAEGLLRYAQAVTRRVEAQKQPKRSWFGVAAMVVGMSLLGAAAAHAGTDVPSDPTPIGNIVSWLHLNFANEGLAVLKGTIGATITFWTMGKATKSARYLLNKFTELMPLHRNMIVALIGTAVATLGLGKTMVLMGLNWGTVGTIFAGSALLPVVLPLLTSLVTKGGAGNAPQPFANQFAGLLMGLGLDMPFSEGDEITLKIDGEDIKGIVKEIQISRTRVEITVNGVTREERIANSALVWATRIGWSGKETSKKRDGGNGAAGHSHGDDLIPSSELGEYRALRDRKSVQEARVRVLQATITRMDQLPQLQAVVEQRWAAKTELDRRAAELAELKIQMGVYEAKYPALRGPPAFGLKGWTAVLTGGVLLAATIIGQPMLVPSLILSASLIGSILIHEAAHLFMLRRLGDNTAARYGIFSSNPLQQIDPVGTVLVPAATFFLSALAGVPTMFGWARPVPVDFNKMKDPKRDPAKVAMAGPIANLAVAALAGGAMLALPSLGAGTVVIALAAGMAKMNLALAVFNVLPLPNLDGGKLAVARMSDAQYEKWTHNPAIADNTYQKTYRRLFQGPANLLSRLHMHDQHNGNMVTRATTLVIFAAAAAAGYYFLGLPLLFLILPCSYDYYCIREKIQNERATNEIRDIMRQMAASLVKAAEEDESVKSEVDAYEVEHILKNALEDLIDSVVDSEGFAGLSEDQKWDRFLEQYKGKAVEALLNSPKGMPLDSPETIRRLLETEGGKKFFANIRQWIDRNEVWSKWKSPARKNDLRDAVKDKPKERGGNGAAAPEQGSPKQKSFEEMLDDKTLGMSDKEKAFLLLHLKEMKLEEKPPVVGRVDEMDQLVATVASPRGVISSVVLIGKAGVGKTAVAEKLAQSLALSDRSANGTFGLKKLSDRYLVKLNLGRLLQADDPAKALDVLLQLLGKFNEGDKRKGNKVLLFVDEIHQLFAHPKGAQMANLLKEPLRDGEISIVAATTEEEYKQYMESDDAFKRRLIPIWLKESTTQETMRSLQGSRGYYEGLFELSIHPDALKAAADLSKYDQEVFLPGRAFKYLVLAAAQASFDGQRDRLSLKIADTMADLQYAMGQLSEHLAKDSLITKGLKEDEPTAIELYNWVAELSRRLVELYAKRDAIPTSGKPTLTEDLVKEEIARKTGVASGQLTMGKEPMEKYIKMEEIVSKRVIGQEEPVHVISDAVRKNKAGLSDPKRPLGVFYLTGPTGTGKTHLAKELARFLFNDPDAVIRVDMSEYMEGHSVSRMIGAPPGYVGHDAGGQLTEAVRKKPYSIILFDEIEKAHQDVWDILLQITGDGRLTDGKGRTIDFKNTIILMTSNLGMNAVDVGPYEAEYTALKAQLAQIDSMVEGMKATGQWNDVEKGRFEAQREEVRAKQRELAKRLATETKVRATEVTEKAFKEVYRPEFQGRLHAPPIVFNRITPDMASKIVDLNLKELASVLGYAGHELTWNPEVATYLAEQGFSIALGARPLQNTIEQLVTQPIAGEILRTAVTNGERVQPSAIALSVVEGKVKIAVNALPPKAVTRKEAEEGAARELFTRVLQEVLDAAAKGIVPNAGLEVIDTWVTSTIKEGARPSINPSPAPAGEVESRNAAPGEGIAAPVFSANQPLTIENGTTITATSNNPRAKDAALKQAREALEKAPDVITRTFEEEGKPYVGWLKLFLTHAKEMSAEGAAAVKITSAVDSKSAKVSIHRDGAVGEKEAELLRRHFTGRVPESRDAAFGKAETWNVMGRGGREHWLELYRLLAATPGAKLGYSTSGTGTDYWIEMPVEQAAPTPAVENPSPAPAGEVETPEGRPGEGAILTLVNADSQIGDTVVMVQFAPGTELEAIDQMLAEVGVTRDRYWDAGTGYQLHFQTQNISHSGNIALALSRGSLQMSIRVSPAVVEYINRFQGTVLSPKIKKGSSGEYILRVTFDGESSQADVQDLMERLHIANYQLVNRDSGRSNDWTRLVTVRASSLTEAARFARALADEADVREVRTHAKVFKVLRGATARAEGSSTVSPGAGEATPRRAPIEGTDTPGFRANDLEVHFPVGTSNDDVFRIMREHGIGGGGMHYGNSEYGTIERVGMASREAARAKAEEMAGVAGVMKVRIYRDRNTDSLISTTSGDPVLGPEPDRSLLSKHSDDDETDNNQRLAIEHIRSAIQSDGDYTHRTAQAIDNFFWTVSRFMLDRSAGTVEIRRKTTEDETKLVIREARDHAFTDDEKARLEEMFTPAALEEEFTGNLRHAGIRIHYTDDGSVWIHVANLPSSRNPSPAPAGEVESRPAAPGEGVTSGLHSQVKQILMAMLRQGEDRGPTLRLAIGEALAAVATADDVAQAREWIADTDNLAQNLPKVVAATLILSKFGRRAEDLPRIQEAMRILNSQYTHSYSFNPAKTIASEAIAALHATTGTAGARKLLKKFREARDARTERNDILKDALYIALARYGDETAWEAIKEGWNDKFADAAYAYAKREKPGVLRKYLADFRRTHSIEAEKDGMLMAQAVADLGTREDSEQLKTWLLEQQTSYNPTHLENAASAFGRMVDRLQAADETLAPFRAELSEQTTLSDSSNFTKLIRALNVLAEAGDASDLERVAAIFRIDPTNVNAQHEMTQHVAAVAWAKIVERRGLVTRYLTQPDSRAELPILMEMLSDRNAIVNKAAVEALKLHLGKKKASSPRGRGVGVADGVGTVPTPSTPEPTNAFFTTDRPNYGEELHTFFTSNAEIEANADSKLSRLPAATRALAWEWVSEFQRYMRRLAEVEFKRDVRVKTDADGRVTIWFVLSEGVTTEFNPLQAARIRRAVVAMLNAIDRNSDLEFLRGLIAAQGAKMGLDYDAGRQYEPNRGTMELWLKLEIPGSATAAAPPTPYYPQRPSNPRFRDWDDPMWGGPGGPHY